MVEQVEAVEVEEYPEEEEYYGRRRITAGPIIAVIVVIVIISGVMLYMFWGTGVESVTITNVQDIEESNGQHMGISIEALITSGGAQRVNGECKLDVIFNGEKVYTDSVDVNDDVARAEIYYSDFVLENGYYTFRISMEGKSDTPDQDVYINHVPEILELDFATTIEDDTGEKQHAASISPADPENEERIVFTWYNRNYRISVSIEDPSGYVDEISKTMYEFHPNSTFIQVDVGGDMMGNYTVSAEFENLLVRDDSPFRTLESEPEYDDIYINRVPEITDIDHTPSSPRPGETVEIEFSAFDPDQNGGITAFLIDWGDPDYQKADEVIVDGDSSESGTATHTYESADTYNVVISATDNGVNYNIGPGSTGDPFIGSETASVEYQIQVSRIPFP